MFKNIVIGISGGVDSAVATFLLKKKGFNVTAAFLRNWDTADETGRCLIDEDLNDAEYICKKLDVPLIEVNFVKEYWNYVFSYFLNTYENGDTPNPDIMCNKNIKFDLFYKYARNVLNADAIATGHYVNTSFGPYLENYQSHTKVKLLKGIDNVKDQSFFLSQVQQEPLQRCMFPLAYYRKFKVKQIATEIGLKRIAEKDESMGICFIGSRKFQKFIPEYIEDKPGNFIDYDTGKIVGKHQGFHYWTLGQRSRISGVAKPYFIYRKLKDTNDILVVQGTNHPCLYSLMAITSEPHWICEEPSDLKNSNAVFHCDFKFQHAEHLVQCKVFQTPSRKLIISVDKPKRAISSGQFAVLYLNNECLGSAPIINAGPSLLSLGKTLSDFNDDHVNNNDDTRSNMVIENN
ncbi:mitochondrial tRNA-specific 2-thiouridylase 1 isoform X2 [Chelonus insularis]|nr:mitochondrial tRNA-specific 2-thiouridylase 1 isoform X2 [Chelonus insularis]XP_034952230.1 mitochondrial tRNA-specific 2-thiouridylase 1 isoform X2 [Chelonus insularis]XP_034952239.1 mitochondrial tRNA-specific 2-thiouridylase 1 isoform X2 [Chelonus insularis]